MRSFHSKIRSKHADGMANCVDPDQTAPLGAVLSGSTQFAKTCMSESWGHYRFQTDSADPDQSVPRGAI